MEREREIIGSIEYLSFPELGFNDVASRVDTGARTSAIWASHITIEDKQLAFTLFDKKSPLYTGQVIYAKHFDLRTIVSSNGAMEQRYSVKLLVTLRGRKIRAHFTLANRSSQLYPILVGRNILRGKFIVDVKLGGLPDMPIHMTQSALVENSTRKEPQ